MQKLVTVDKMLAIEKQADSNGLTYQKMLEMKSVNGLFTKKSVVERADNFRPDYRVPEKFRADLVDYEGSGYDRGHLISSADQRGIEILATIYLLHQARLMPR